MNQKLPKWCKAILELKDGKIKNDIPYFNLNELAFKRLKECKPNSNGVINFKNVRSKICRNFSINKKQCMELLKYFEVIGKIEFVKQRGIKII